MDRDRESQYDYSWYAEYYDNVTRPAYNAEYCGYECWASYHYDALGNPVESSQYVDQDESWSRESHEFRIQSQEGRLKWIAGVFYQEQEHDFDLRWTAPSVGPAVTLVPGGPTVVWQTHQTRVDEERAIFGEISFDITDDLTILGGLRKYSYDNSLFGFNGWSGRCTGFYDDNGNFVEDRDNGTLQSPCYDTGILDDKSDNSDKIGKLNVTYNITDDVMVYFTWSEGYRAGGVNRAVEGAAYDEDFVTNREIGWKASLMDNRMRLNGALYRMDWDDFQYSSLVLGAGQPLTVINNAGQAEVTGMEFDLNFAVTDAVTFTFSGSFIDAESTEEILTADGIIPAGTELPYTPEVQLTSVLRYGAEWDGFEVYAQGAWSYTDGASTDLRPDYSLMTDS